MSWLAAVLLRVGELGLWGVLLFILLYVAAAVTLAPAFVLSVAGRRALRCLEGLGTCAGERDAGRDGRRTASHA
jgi:hypothetical protein